MFSVDGVLSGVDTLMTDGVPGTVEGELITDDEKEHLIQCLPKSNETTILINAHSLH